MGWQPPSHGKDASVTPTGGDVLAIDPVCGMQVNPKTAHQHAEQSYHFRSAKCRLEFIVDSKKIPAQ